MVNTSQQVGGSIGTALLNTLAATAAAGYLSSHTPVTPEVGVRAALASYATAYWWGRGILRVVGAVVGGGAPLPPPRTGMSLGTALPRRTGMREPVIAH